jgi:hypothetical protein
MVSCSKSKSKSKSISRRTDLLKKFIKAVFEEDITEVKKLAPKIAKEDVCPKKKRTALERVQKKIKEWNDDICKQQTSVDDCYQTKKCVVRFSKGKKKCVKKPKATNLAEDIKDRNEVKKMIADVVDTLASPLRIVIAPCDGSRRRSKGRKSKSKGRKSKSKGRKSKSKGRKSKSKGRKSKSKGRKSKSRKLMKRMMSAVRSKSKKLLKRMVSVMKSKRMTRRSKRMSRRSKRMARRSKRMSRRSKRVARRSKRVARRSRRMSKKSKRMSKRK